MPSAQLTDAINQEIRQTVAFVTLGQTPRDDVVPELRALVGRSIDVREFGVLDDIPSDKLAGLRPDPGDPALLTRLRSGVDVVLSLDWTSDRMNVIYSKIVARDIDLVVLMSTLLGDTPAPASATIFCDKVVARAVDAFTAGGLHVGLILSLESQADLVVCGIARRDMIRAAVARPGDHGALVSAVGELRDCDVLILHSVTYSEREQQEVLRRFDRPVVLARQLVASAIREALDRLAAPCGPDSNGALRERLRTLSPREREIMFLVAEGLANKEIAFRLGISFRTVEIHRARMIGKMGFRTLTDLVRTVDSLLGF